MLETIFFSFIAFTFMACLQKSAALQKPPLESVSGQAAQTIGLLWWPADSSKSLHPFADDVDECLTDILAVRCPEFELMHQQLVRDSLFPLMEPGTQPTSEESFTALLTREDVRKRLADKGLRYLVSFTGGTSRDYKGSINCGGGAGGVGCLGFAWIDKDTRIDAVIWEIEGKNQVGHLEGSAKGKTLIPAFILPIPIPAPTVSIACDRLGQRIVEYIRISSDDTDCNNKR